MNKRIPLIVAIIAVAALAGCGRGKPGETGRPAQPEKPPLPSRIVHVFCYHGVEPETENFYFNRTADFEEQMQTLADEGFASITCKQLADYLAGEQDIPEKSVLLTFDDGNLCVYEKACPIMEKHGFKATLFLITGSMGGKTRMDWQHVRDLHSRGYEIGAHTVTHANLTKRSEGQSVEEHEASVVKELTESKEKIEQMIDEPVVAVAYPYGNYDEFVMSAVREAGYRLGFSIDRGAVDEQSSPWRLPRQMVVRDNSLRTFKRWLAQEPLHLAGLSPAIGQVVSQTDIEIRARVLDDDVNPSALSVEAGKGTDLSVNEETDEIVITTTLSKGANNVRLQHAGSPSRERSWVIVCRP